MQSFSTITMQRLDNTIANILSGWVKLTVVHKFPLPDSLCYLCACYHAEPVCMLPTCLWPAAYLLFPAFQFQPFLFVWFLLGCLLTSKDSFFLIIVQCKLLLSLPAKSFAFSTYHVASPCDTCTNERGKWASDLTLIIIGTFSPLPLIHWLV